MSDSVAADGSGLNSITLATGGLIVGSRRGRPCSAWPA